MILRKVTWYEITKTLKIYGARRKRTMLLRKPTRYEFMVLLKDMESHPIPARHKKIKQIMSGSDSSETNSDEDTLTEIEKSGTTTRTLEDFVQSLSNAQLQEILKKRERNSLPLSNSTKEFLTGRSFTLAGTNQNGELDLDAMSGITEDDDDVQKRLYREENAGIQKNKNVEGSITEWLQGHIFPYVKFWSDSEKKFDYPDFVSKDKEVREEQARVICEGILDYVKVRDETMTMEKKVRFWITYRSVVKKELVKYRCNASQQIKDLYVKGMDT